MEENMGIDIPNEEAEKIATVEAAINTFYRHLSEKADKANTSEK
jgi:acyl carrier protein